MPKFEVIEGDDNPRPWRGDAEPVTCPSCDSAVIVKGKSHAVRHPKTGKITAGINVWVCARCGQIVD